MENDVLGRLGDVMRGLLETKMESTIETEYRPTFTKNNRSMAISYHRSTVKPSAS